MKNLNFESSDHHAFHSSLGHSFSAFSNSELHQKTLELVGEETRLTLLILHHLREIERRRLFAEMGYPSLFEYAVSELKYSEPSAQRRISAMRALREMPELEERIEEGKLKLTQIAQIQTFFRAEKKAGKTYSAEAKREIFEETIGLSTRETERLLADKSPTSAVPERITALDQETSKLTLVLENDVIQKLEQIRDRFAHRLPPAASLSDVIGFAADQVLEKLPEKKKEKNSPPPKDEIKEARSPGREVDSESKSSVSAPEVKSDEGKTYGRPVLKPVEDSLEKPSRSISIPLRRQIWRRDQGRCQFRSPEGKLCGSMHRLEIDHMLSFLPSIPKDKSSLFHPQKMDRTSSA